MSMLGIELMTFGRAILQLPCDCAWNLHIRFLSVTYAAEDVSSKAMAPISAPPSAATCYAAYPVILHLLFMAGWRLLSCCLALDSSSSFPCPAFRAIAKSCKESLVWFKASGFYYTIDAGSSLELLLDILLLPCVVKILQLLGCRMDPFMSFSR
ncbi:hypothetical protein STEG23_027374 [Scotinomys teguina]